MQFIDNEIIANIWFINSNFQDFSSIYQKAFLFFFKLNNLYPYFIELEIEANIFYSMAKTLIV